MKQPQPFGGLSRFGDSHPCRSAAFLRMPARLIALVRSGPGGIFLAASSATSASISRSRLGWGFLTDRATVLVLRLMFEFRFAARRQTRCGVLPPRRLRLGGSPARGVGIERINCLDSDLGVCAFWTSVGPVFETFGPR